MVAASSLCLQRSEHASCAAPKRRATAAALFATIMPAATAFEEFFKRYAQLPAEERGVEAFARVAAETRAFEVVGPPLAESDPL
jgi:hypothetical protein